MREFDIDKVITPVSAQNAVIGKHYYFGDALSILRRNFLDNKTPKKLVSICDVFIGVHPFLMEEGNYSFLYPYEGTDASDNATYRELAKWLAQGNGEWSRDGGKSIFIDMTYVDSDGDTSVLNDVRVRAFGENEWVLPMKKYLEEHTR